MKIIALSEDTEHKKLKFLVASRLFREKTKAQSLKDISKEARKIRDEVYAEWFRD